MSRRRELNPNSPTDRNLNDRRSHIKIKNTSSQQQRDKGLPRMSGLEGKTIRGHLHNGRYVWG